MVQEGASAPDFSLPDMEGNPHSLADITAEYVVIYFYPKDSTPGCTIEAKEFSEALPAFSRLRTAVVGISGGDARSKKKFCEKHDLGVLLLSDSDFSAAKRYDAYGEKSFMGRRFNGIFRCTFVLDKKRRVMKRFDEVKARGHAQEVLDFISEQEAE